MKPTIFILAVLLCFNGCSNPKSQNPGTEIWKAPPRTVVSNEVIKAEIAEKEGRIMQFLSAEKLDAMLLTQVRNVYWVTAGLADNQIVLNKDVGGASLLFTRSGGKYLVCNGSEAGRLMDESLGALGYTLKMFDWYEANPVRDVRGEVLRSIAGKGRIGSDAPYPGTVNVAENFRPLRYRLTDGDVARYRWIGRQATEAVCDVCRRVQPGMDEFEIEAMTAAELRSRGIVSTVLLIAVDERISKYRHALAGGAKLRNYVMVNVVAERWGMPVAVTRFAHFGPLPDELAQKIDKVARIGARYEAATVPGKSCGEIFEACKQWYADAGYEGEWKKHHQGGATGYDDREYVIYPGIQETVQERQAFAWNPTITGAKVEDTIISYKDSVEIITKADNWPLIPVTLDGRTYPQPGILIR